MPAQRRHVLPVASPGAPLLRRLARDRSGNTLVIIAASVAPLLAMVGGGVDMGRSYLSESRLQQACDAGVLAARKRLGSTAPVSGEIPSDVAEVGQRFFNVNFRDGAYGTENRQFAMTLEADFSISGAASVDVPTTIMRIFGNDNVPVQVDCQAQLNFSNTDVMMVLDTTGSMTEVNPGDSDSRIEVLKDVVRSFHAQLEASKGPGIRMRYGFVPYSVNVNVGSLLENGWVVDRWTYQSVENASATTSTSTRSWDENWAYISGSYSETTVSSYAATWHAPASESSSGYYSCDTPAPAGNATTNYQLLSTTSEPWAGPPAGTKTTQRYRRTINGSWYWVDQQGTTCNVRRADYASYIDEYDWITVPAEYSVQSYRYAPIERNVANWRSWANGCIEERSTYEIDDYSAVDFTRALDLDLDTVPTPGDPDTQWRPAYPEIIRGRALDWWGNGSFDVNEVITTDPYFYRPAWQGMATCPAAARNLAPMTATEIDSYLGTLTTGGYTYHDIGMIWGGRLISPTGLFADENADVDGRATSRHLIFLTDGETRPMDLTYGAYGIEPLDRRRWSDTSPMSLTETVENRFTVACNEVKKRNVTVWVVGFGTTMTDMLKQCAGDGRWFQADDAAQLNDVFNRIAKAMGDLRISR